MLLFFSVWRWPALDADPKAALSGCSKCSEQEGQFSTRSCEGRPHRESWEVILGEKFRDIGVLSGAWVCESNVCLRKARGSGKWQESKGMCGARRIAGEEQKNFSKGRAALYQ